MTEVLVDTDVFIDHLRGDREIRTGRDAVHYSVVTRCELFAGPAEQADTVAKLLAPFREHQIDRSIAEVAGTMRRDTGARIADALIAATAISRGLTLVTRNLRDFERIPGLKVRSPR